MHLNTIFIAFWKKSESQAEIKLLPEKSQPCSNSSCPAFFPLTFTLFNHVEKKKKKMHAVQGTLRETWDSAVLHDPQ